MKVESSHDKQGEAGLPLLFAGRDFYLRAFHSSTTPIESQLP